METSETQQNSPDGRPILNVEGELVTLGPLRRDLIPLYARWINDPETARAVGSFTPYTIERETDWYEKEARSETNLPFTVYERSTMLPIGTVALMGVDYRNRRAEFGIGIGEPDYRNKGYGTETTRLVLDYAFNVVGLHSVMLGVFEFNRRAVRAYEKAGLGDRTTQAELLRGRADVGRDLDGLPRPRVRRFRPRDRSGRPLKKGHRSLASLAPRQRSSRSLISASAPLSFGS